MRLSELVHTYPRGRVFSAELHVGVPQTTAEQPAEGESALQQRGDGENGPHVQVALG